MQTPRTEFAQALKAVVAERGLDAEVIIETIKQAIIAAFKRDARDRGEDVEEMELEVEIDPVNGKATIFSPASGKSKKRKDITPPGFGRIAAQTAKQVIHQKIREAEKSSVMEEFGKRVGTLVSGVILRFDGPNVRVDIGRTEAMMPVEERVPNEHLAPNQRLTFLLKEIKEGMRGKEIVLSRVDPGFVRALFAREVPEINSGGVEIKTIAREAGVRAKITVFSDQSGVDPVGSCVGQKGVRVQAVTNELGGERIDIIPWSEDPKELIEASLSPAEGVTVVLDEKNKIAKVKAPEDQLSLAIGRDGQNARLSAKLTGWKIEIETPESLEDRPAKEKKEKVEKEAEKKTKKEVEKEEEEEKKEKKTKTKKSKVEKVEKKEAGKEDKGSDGVSDSAKKSASDSGKRKKQRKNRGILRTPSQTKVK